MVPSTQNPKLSTIPSCPSTQNTELSTIPSFGSLHPEHIAINHSLFWVPPPRTQSYQPFPFLGPSIQNPQLSTIPSFGSLYPEPTAINHSLFWVPPPRTQSHQSLPLLGPSTQNPEPSTTPSFGSLHPEPRAINHSLSSALLDYDVIFVCQTCCQKFCLYHFRLPGSFKLIFSNLLKQQVTCVVDMLTFIYGLHYLSRVLIICVCDCSDSKHKLIDTCTQTFIILHLKLHYQPRGCRISFSLSPPLSHTT